MSTWAAPARKLAAAQAHEQAVQSIQSAQKQMTLNRRRVESTRQPGRRRPVEPVPVVRFGCKGTSDWRQGRASVNDNGGPGDFGLATRWV
jgi:hypothetical protein